MNPNTKVKKKKDGTKITEEFVQETGKESKRHEDQRKDAKWKERWEESELPGGG